MRPLHPAVGRKGAFCRRNFTGWTSLHSEKEKNGWLYVESGKVRGFVKESELYTGDAAQVLLSGYQKQAKKLQKKLRLHTLESKEQHPLQKKRFRQMKIRHLPMYVQP